MVGVIVAEDKTIVLDQARVGGQILMGCRLGVHAINVDPVQLAGGKKYGRVFRVVAMHFYNTMRDFMAQLIRRREVSAADEEAEAELDEFAWEERLKESDRLTDAYQEVIEKYMEDADSERKEAFVMGWDGLLDALAERDEADGDFPGESWPYDPRADAGGDAPDALESEDAFFDDLEEHPLQAQAQELAMRAMDVVQQDAKAGTPAYQLVSCLLQVSGKLAGALNGRDSEFDPEPGFVLAILKRCLNWLNVAVGACQQLMAEENDPDQLAALAHLRSSAFAVRDGIVELRRELK